LRYPNTLIECKHAPLLLAIRTLIMDRLDATKQGKVALGLQKRL
jgi:hypothetical protein